MKFGFVVIIFHAKLYKISTSFGTFSGPNVIVFYAVEIFNDVGVSTSGYLAAIITAASRVLGGDEMREK